MVGGWKAQYSVKKVFAIGSDKGLIAACSGNYSSACAFMEWLRNPGEDRPELADDTSILVVEALDRLRVYEGSGDFPISAPFVALGSGMPPATAAMIMGASAKRAIEIASMLDDGTGPDVFAMNFAGEIV
jgi:hypothetical protein